MAEKKVAPTIAELAAGAAGAQPVNYEDGSCVITVRYRRTPSSPVLEGAFHIHVPSLNDDLQIAKLKAAYTGGAPWASFSPEDQRLYEALAVCNVLIDEPRPKWFSVTIDKIDTGLIIGMAMRIRQWEVEFFRGSPDEGGAKPAEPRLEFLPAVGA